MTGRQIDHLSTWLLSAMLLAAPVGCGRLDASLTAERIVSGDAGLVHVPVVTLADPLTGFIGYVRGYVATVVITTDESAKMWCLSETQTAVPAPSTSGCSSGWLMTRPTTFTLSGGEGMKTVYLWVADGSGHVSSAAALALVSVETTLPVAPFVHLSDPISHSVTLADQSAASLSIVSAGAGKWCVFEQASAAGAPTAPLFGDVCWVSALPTAQILGAYGNRTVYVYRQDVFGNISSAGTASIKHAAPSALSANFHTTCATDAGNAYCWGYNSNGQLGNNSTTDSYLPVPVSGLASGVTAIGVGQYQSCAAVNGSAWCWGDNGNGQLGNNSTTDSLVPVQVSGLTSGVTAITSDNSAAFGTSFSCAVMNGGACYSRSQIARNAWATLRSASDSGIPSRLTR